MVKKFCEMNFGDGGGGRGDENGDERRKKSNSSKKPNSTPNASPNNEEENEEEELREEADEGQLLYLDFFQREVRQNGLEREVPSQWNHENLQNIPYLMSMHSEWSRAGRELRQVADAFARSPEREMVRQRAQKVSGGLESLDSEQFLRLLQELFQEGGVTRERILVLFFFCADIALEALRRGSPSLFIQLMKWTANYISTRVALWVHQHGGWGAVLTSSLNIAYQVSASCAFIAVIAVCCVYIRRNT